MVSVGGQKGALMSGLFIAASLDHLIPPQVDGLSPYEDGLTPLGWIVLPLVCCTRRHFSMVMGPDFLAF